MTERFSSNICSSHRNNDEIGEDADLSLVHNSPAHDDRIAALETDRSNGSAILSYSEAGAAIKTPGSPYRPKSGGSIMITFIDTIIRRVFRSPRDSLAPTYLA